LAQSDGHDAPGLIDQVVPSLAAMIDEIVVGFEDAVGKPVVAHELPDILDRIELGAFWRQRKDGDVGRHEDSSRQVPAGLIDQKDGVATLLARADEERSSKHSKHLATSPIASPSADHSNQPRIGQLDRRPLDTNDTKSPVRDIGTIRTGVMLAATSRIHTSLDAMEQHR